MDAVKVAAALVLAVSWLVVGSLGVMFLMYRRHPIMRWRYWKLGLISVGGNMLVVTYTMVALAMGVETQNCRFVLILSLVAVFLVIPPYVIRCVLFSRVARAKDTIDSDRMTLLTAKQRRSGDVRRTLYVCYGFLAVGLVFGIAICVLQWLVHPLYEAGDVGCLVLQEQWYALVTLVVFLLAAVGTIFFTGRGTDGVNMRPEAYINIAVWAVCGTLYFLMVSQFSRDALRVDWFHPYWLLLIRGVVMAVTTLLLPIVTIVWRSRRLVDVTVDGQARYTLANMYIDKEVRAFFIDALKQAYAEENIMFLYALNRLDEGTGVGRNSGSLDEPGSAREKRITVEDLMECFIVSNSPMELNLTSRTKSALVEQYGTDGSAMVRADFDGAKKEIEKLVVDHMRTYPMAKGMELSVLESGVSERTVENA